ncbi:hypothetical protein [Sulfurimonas sp.]|jgi:hypothetical protein|uniref:hypothetical protein n=1 Tax=Sulfurimonas sp. TaxID=2022749 RepID=UPI0025F78461|nr:hypothetical protein [Sulfurimonas sp.]MBT5935066.1 hypothetical protein [Sulfurimonas sp.]
MIANIFFLLLAGGLPYYLILEKSDIFSSKSIFKVSGLFLLIAIILTFFIEKEIPTQFVIISFLSALYSIYRATQTTNFYKLAYYFIFMNAPFFMLFESHGAFYSLSLLVSLIGIYAIASFYEKHYGSANYLYVRGITLATPLVGIHITVYLISIGLYPPLPNSLFFLTYIFNSEADLLWFIVVITLYFGNFLVSMKVLEKSIFGKTNPNIHYVDLNFKEKITHFIIIILLILLSIHGIREILLWVL